MLPRWTKITHQAPISVFSGSFSANNLLATIPVWGPEYQLSFEFSLTSLPPSYSSDSTMVMLTNSGTTTAGEAGNRVPATFLRTEGQDTSVLVSVDIETSAPWEMAAEEQYLLHNKN